MRDAKRPWGRPGHQELLHVLRVIASWNVVELYRTIQKIHLTQFDISDTRESIILNKNVIQGFIISKELLVIDDLISIILLSYILRKVFENWLCGCEIWTLWLKILDSVVMDFGLCGFEFWALL